MYKNVFSDNRSQTVRRSLEGKVIKREQVVVKGSFARELKRKEVNADEAEEEVHRLVNGCGCYGGDDAGIKHAGVCRRRYCCQRV